ncbi:hypothetical protein [Chitinophaga sancti]|uniref:Uncharacterized protein n=1 Tax=Chitinophaga sancti TaxID=1004 RepID=A0A1K1LT41_9BACT|nr:hypothetical protein [Chitinophaga sancti]WQD64869.1 hypothetical protein U0033_10725 [Chitinophaga sancti]WQG89507.1 hypothetical protein SR876_31745 [Chitinophaga sancti]SFW14039.1 hypothetical protein SAMN05661012_00195 [Chitinophaga sancti]
MKHLFIPLLLGILLWGAACVPPRNGPPRPPKPPTPPHGAIQQALPDTAFMAPVIV